MMQVMEELGPGHDAMARKIKDRLALAARKARERAKAHRPAAVDASTRPSRIVFQTRHGPAYTVEREIGYGLRTGNGSPTTKITLPFVSIQSAALSEKE